jgi:hypothetical protein
LALIAAATGIAHGSTIDDAFPPTIRVGAPSTGKLAAISLERGEVLWLAISVTARFKTDRVVVPVDLPAGAHVLGIQVARDDKVVWGQIRPRQAAANRYEHAAAPTLLSWLGTSADVDHLELRIDCADATTVTLALELPELHSVHLEPARLARVDGAAVRGAIALEPHDPVAAPHVDAETSLVAEPAGAITIVFDGAGPTLDGSIDKAMIRRRMKAAIPALRHCYEVVAQGRPDLAGHVDVHLMIEQDGQLSSVTVDGSLDSDDVKTCIANVASAMEFPAARGGGGGVQVNWPLELRPSR